MALRKLFREKGGASAIESAIVAPVFIPIVLTLVAFGIYLSVASSIQQIAADAARTAIAGLNASERNVLARNFIAQSTLNYYLIDPAKLIVSVTDDQLNEQQFTVRLEYDASDLPIWSLYSFALPDKTIKRFTTIRIGGI
ncbi:TadE/TadG family type IV pilus assembly protein [Rhizobium sp. TH2]|uniref:TadE/TadG family type IV pilus assembly protein n=1 Tax=Rhizobium sp. TH2 TaxID=2775403 RepID=UPI00215732D1|nr:TadE/TadG family type IV pilus assembly protein [Rhizobium sp. TH2]